MGWQPFGLPARSENAAIERESIPGLNRRKHRPDCRAQLQRLGLSIDGTRGRLAQPATPTITAGPRCCSLHFHEGALDPTQKKAHGHLGPIDQTVLVNEQVTSEGRSWRSGAKWRNGSCAMFPCASPTTRGFCFDDLNQLDGCPRVRNDARPTD